MCLASSTEDFELKTLLGQDHLHVYLLFSLIRQCQIQASNIVKPCLVHAHNY